MHNHPEISQRAAKALRFGLEQIQQDADDKPEQNPDRLTNRERIVEEYEHREPANDELILCSSCWDAFDGDGQVHGIIPQSVCMKCGRECMGYGAQPATPEEP